MSIGSRIKEARLSRGMTQEQLASALHITCGAVGNYESDLTTPKRDIMCRIMEVLRCDANFLYQDLVKTTNEMYVTLSERSIIKKYRVLDDYGQRAVDAVIDIEYERCSDLYADDIQVLAAHVSDRPDINEPDR